MLDDLRNSAESEYEQSTSNEYVYENTAKQRRKAFLGMTAGQRFIIAFFIFILVAIAGIFILIVSEKIFPLI
jgi:hypothetical protein